MEIRRYVRILVNRKWVVILTTLVTLAVVAVGSFLTTPVYTASAMVRIAERRTGSGVIIDLNYMERLIKTHVLLLQSRPYLEEVIRRVGLTVEPDALSKTITVEALTNTELVKISAESTDPQQAAAIANTLGTLLVEEEQQLRDNNVSLAEPAIAPSKPSKPRILLNVALSAVVGIAGGVGLAFLFESLDPAIHSAEDLEAIAKVHLLGRIPNWSWRRRFRHKASLLEDGAVQSAVGEAFRILSTNLLALTSKAPVKTIMVSSAEPGAGKTTVLINLATAIARAGRQVIVVDGDLRNASIHNVFDLAQEPGLSDAILDPSQLSSAVQETKIKGVRALASGSLQTDPAKVLNTSALRKVILKLAEEADIVLWDSPPLLAAADAALLASAVDGVVLVVERTHARREAVQAACRQLANVEARLIGTVMNRTGPGVSYYGHRTPTNQR